MIDEHHPMQIGMFPMDMKCQTPHQLQLHHEHLQYQHQQHQQYPNHQHQHSQQQHQQLHHNGNERMLTASSSLVAAGGSGVTPPTSSAATTTPSSTPPPLPPPTAASSPSSSTSGKRSCNNHIGGMNNKTTLLHGVSNTPESCRPLHTHQNHPHHQHHHQQHQHQRTPSTDNQQSNVCGPGPPGLKQPPPPTVITSTSSNNTKGNGNGNTELTKGPSSLLVSSTLGISESGRVAPTPHALLPPNAAHTLTSVSGRIALGECSLNAGGNIDWPNNGGGGGIGVDDEDDDDSNNKNASVLPISMSSVSVDEDGIRVGVIGLTSGMPTATTPHQQLQHQNHHINNNHQVAKTIAMLSTSSVTCKLPLSSANCALCCQPICDRYIMRVVDTSFHEGCLKCATCSLRLVQSCFTRDGKLYCRIDYERLFMRNRCLGCGHKINSEELVMRTLENVFHLKCFACVVCGCMLKKGEQYVVKQGQLFCRFDYEKEVEMLQGYDFYGDDLFPPKLDGRRGPKRPRTILNTQQRRAFKTSFEVSPKPCRKVRENLAKETGLSLRIVQVWFQNQRAKVKKIQKKAKQEHPKGHSDSQDSQESDSSCLAKIKDEAHSDTESLLESPFIMGGVGVGGNGLTMSGGAVSGQAELMGGCGFFGVGGKLSRCIIKDEHENTSYNCMETNKENCNKTNEPIVNTFVGLSYATFQQLMVPFSQSPMINPIDRLYSMQNSYFRPDDPIGGYSEYSKDIGEL